MKLSMSAAIGSMKLLLESDIVEAVEALGCNKKEWEMLTGNKPWTPQRRPTVTRTLQMLIYAQLDRMGLPRIPVPAEYAASVISVFVSSSNVLPACAILGTFVKGEDIISQGQKIDAVEGMEKVKPETLFAMCIEITSGQPIDMLVKRFMERTDKAIGYQLKEQTNAE